MTNIEEIWNDIEHICHHYDKPPGLSEFLMCYFRENHSYHLEYFYIKIREIYMDGRIYISYEFTEDPDDNSYIKDTLASFLNQFFTDDKVRQATISKILSD